MSRGPQQQPGELAPGARLGGIEIVSLIGRGGMGAVWKGFERDLDRTVAVKTLGEDVAGNPAYLERFHREARAACRVQNHPHVVSIHALGTHEGLPFIVMEFVEGESLATLVAGGPLPVERMAELMQGICSGVNAIHAAGIIHRDLKPQNIVIAPGFAGPAPKILDFGIAKGVGVSSLTARGAVVGTQLYLSPEQIRDQPLDGRSDVFSLGVILYECLTGTRPHEDKPFTQYVSDLLEGRFTRPRELRPDLPAAVEAVILRAMSVEPAARYATAHDLGAALLPFAPPNARRSWAAYYATHAVGVGAAAATASEELPVPAPRRGTSMVAPPTTPLEIPRAGAGDGRGQQRAAGIAVGAALGAVVLAVMWSMGGLGQPAGASSAPVVAPAPTPVVVPPPAPPVEPERVAPPEPAAPEEPAPARVPKPPAPHRVHPARPRPASTPAPKAPKPILPIDQL